MEIFNAKRCFSAGLEYRIGATPYAARKRFYKWRFAPVSIPVLSQNIRPAQFGMVGLLTNLDIQERLLEAEIAATADAAPYCAGGIVCCPWFDQSVSDPKQNDFKA